ncbi:hypothetical protein O7627_11700 [Solwaraspora sp. WMMD1047]|uniref:hypothetical protein n=1 Tax=Solwaraspora sp. WMMD1047 TaxID=3016102 RepID=UPI002416146C|nr:hypothetical protein [Solwaraspora sp. WMMD1047]MDG4829963.1 hypothetical protein [Solwaraspora sp. WMMD1047]
MNKIVVHPSTTGLQSPVLSTVLLDDDGRKRWCGVLKNAVSMRLLAAQRALNSPYRGVCSQCSVLPNRMVQRIGVAGCGRVEHLPTHP